MGRSAAKAISEHHNVDLAVDEMLAVLREVVG